MIVNQYTDRYPNIKYLCQENKGPAAARNYSWKNSQADICVFTDGDCVPKIDWLEKLLNPLQDSSIGAAGGGYFTLNESNCLAKFIGLEIASKYSKVKGDIDCHGSYNLAVRKGILEEIKGFDEKYPFPSGEDWDMTYKISSKYRMVYVPDALVGHYHQERFWDYMKNQVRRGFDRVNIYKDHPMKTSSDVYTPWTIKYQILFSGLLIPFIILFKPIFSISWAIPTIVILFLLVSSISNFPYYYQIDKRVAWLSIPVQLCRNYAWLWGLIKGIINLALGRSNHEK